MSLISLNEKAETARLDETQRESPVTPQPLQVHGRPGSQPRHDHQAHQLSPREEVLACLEQIELRVGSHPFVVQVMGPRGGEGVSTVARELARCAASRRTSALLLRYAQSAPEPGGPTPATAASRSGTTLAADMEHVESVVQGLALVRGRPAELELGPSAVATLRDSKPDRERLLNTLRERFQMVLLDSPPVLAGNDGILMAPSTDGVVLVLEAEVTRRPVAEAAVERLRDAGATVLGLMFNKRRHHIPDVVYRLL